VKSNGAYLVLATILLGLVTFRYLVVSRNPAPKSTPVKRTVTVEEDLIPVLPQVAKSVPPEQQVLPPLPTAPEPVVSPNYPIRTKGGTLSYGNSVIARLPDKPPGNKPDPLQAKKKYDPAWGKSKAPPDRQQAARVIPRGGSFLAKDGGRIVVKEELELERVKKRVTAITSVVDRMLAAEGRAACGAVDFYNIPDRISRSQVGTGGDGVMREWWSAASIDMLCRGDIQLCDTRLRKRGSGSQSYAWACPRVGFHAFMKSAVKGSGDSVACEMVLSSGEGGMAAVTALAPESRQRACGLLAAAVKSGDLAICAQFPGLISIGDNAAKACREDLSFVRGALGCSVFSGDSPKSRLDKQSCLSQARILAALKAEDSGRCGDDRLCLAVFGQNSVCGNLQLAEGRERLGNRFCKWAEADLEYRASSTLLTAAQTAKESLHDYQRTLKEFSHGNKKAAKSPHLLHVRAEIVRMQKIAKEQHAAAQKHFEN
jgi:hypothetical protein